MKSYFKIYCDINIYTWSFYFSNMVSNMVFFVFIMSFFCGYDVERFARISIFFVDFVSLKVVNYGIRFDF